MQEDEAPRLIFHPSARSAVYFGTFRFDLADGQLTRDGEEVRLPPRALKILHHLVERAGRVASKQSLMDLAWKDAHVSETSLTEAIGLLRHTLGDDPQKPSFIQTVHRRGYRFIAPLSTDPPGSHAMTGATPQAAAPAPAAYTPARQEDRAGPARWRAALPALLAVALVAAGGSVWAWYSSRPHAEDPVMRVSVAFAADQAPVPGLNTHPVVALSPDGRRFVYVGGTPETARLFMREMNSFDATPVPGTEGAHGPFFSPDGLWIAFFADGHLKKVRATRDQPGAPQVLCATDPGVGGTWVSPGLIVFAPNWRGPLMRVDAGGGTPVPLAQTGGAGYRWPDRLDEDTVIATRWRSSSDDASVVAISVATGAERVIAEPATFGRAGASGHVLFMREGDVFAVRDGQASGRPQAPVRVIPSVMTGSTGVAQFAVSPAGSLLFIDDIPERSLRTLARVDGRGRTADLPVSPRGFRSLSVCGESLAASVFTRGQTHLWAGRVDASAMTQLTREGTVSEPVWLPDCRTIAFSWNRSGTASIYTLATDSGDAPRILFESAVPAAPGSWSPDGRWLAYTERHPDTSGDIWIWDRTTGHRRPVVTTSAMEILPALSPDGTHVAYESNATGGFEIEVANLQNGARTQVSAGGGTWPSWSADSRHLFFLRGTDIVKVTIDARRGQVASGNPAVLFGHPDAVLFRPLGDQFVWMRRTAGSVPLTRTNLVLNWQTEVSRLVH